MDELTQVTLILFILLILLFGCIFSYESGYNEGVCHGKYGTGSTYTNGECFIHITK